MTNRIRLAWTAAALVPVAALAAACSSSGSPSSTSTKGAAMQGQALPSKPASKSASLTETGSTLLFPLISTWAQDYQKLYTDSNGLPLVTITTGATGSGTGLADATTGTVDIGASDAYLSPTTKSQNPSLINIALAISAQQINYNLPGVKNLKLDGKVLASIYLGKITNWNDPAIKALNPGTALPNMKIVTLHRADSSGDTFLFTSYLNKQDAADWPASNVSTSATFKAIHGALGEQGNGGMVAGCAKTKGCIAYIGVSYLSKTQDAGLGQALLKNGAGNFEAPTPAAISAAASALTGNTPASETLDMINGPAPDGYPIVNYEYAIVNTKQSDGTVAEDMRAFLHWAVHAGQDASTYLDAVDFQPLPPAVVTLSDNQIAKIGA